MIVEELGADFQEAFDVLAQVGDGNGEGLRNSACVGVGQVGADFDEIETALAAS